MIFLIIISAALLGGSSRNINAVVTAIGNGTVGVATFTTAVNSTAFHRPSQTWYLGLTNGAETYALSKVSENEIVQGVPQVTPIGTNADIKNLYVNNLALIPSTTTPTQPFIAFTLGASDPTSFSISNCFGTVYAASANLSDSESPGKEIAQILKLAATPNYVIAAVKGNGTTDVNFGADAGDGLALTAVNTTPTTPTFTYYTAGSGSSAAAQALAVSATTFQINHVPTAGPLQSMVYNNNLERLYVSVQMTGTGTDATDSAFGVALYQVNPTTNSLTNLAPCGTNAATVIDGLTRVVGFKGESAIVSLYKMAVMETSSGQYYLIANGGAVAAMGTPAHNVVTAVALVSGTGTALDGTFAVNTTASLETAGFTTQAAAAGDIPAYNAAQAQVGGGPLPIVATTSTIFVSHMEVINDTVYCGLQSTAIDTTDAPGIYYSQAILNDVGKIVAWTNWEKAAPFIAGNSATDGSTSSFAIDATTGDMWTVDAATNTIVKKTAWTTAGTGSTSLVGQLNSNMTNGCFSVYDLNQSIMGQTTAVDRYALFGSKGQVVFAQTSTAEAANNYFSPQTEVSNFSVATALLSTAISGDSSAVTALGYSYSSTNTNTGYFLAGTQNGLYAWANTGTGAGFQGNSLGALNAAPFTPATYSWQKITNVHGAVKRIKSTPNQIYILARSTAQTGAPTDTVYTMSPQTTLTAMNAGVITIATAATGSLSNALLFFDIMPMPSAAADASDKLFLATNNGLYVSGASVNTAANQTAAAWTQVTTPATNSITYDVLAQPANTTLPWVLWGSSWTDSSEGFKTFTRGQWVQITSNATTTLANMPAGQFCTDGTNVTDVPATTWLWSDGGRRIFGGIPEYITQSGVQNMLYALPYRAESTEWNITTEPNPLLDGTGTLATQGSFYWVQAIGATGKILAGTNEGVVSLE